MLSTEVQNEAFPVTQGRLVNHLHRLLRPGPEFGLSADNGADRVDVEQYISERFREAYGAQLTNFLPLLLNMKCRGSLSAAAGLSLGCSAPFFLEQYLHGSVEKVVPEFGFAEVPRNRIAEIGNLVASGNGSSLSLFIVLTSLLNEVGVEYMVFTATRGLRQKFARFGLPATVIAAASESALRQDRATSWGSYYAEQPEVMVARVANAMSLIDGHKLYTLLTMAFKGQIRDLTRQLLRQGGAA